MLVAGSLLQGSSSAAIWVRARCCLAASVGAVGRMVLGGQTSPILMPPLPAGDPDSGRGGDRTLTGLSWWWRLPVTGATCPQLPWLHCPAHRLLQLEGQWGCVGYSILRGCAWLCLGQYLHEKLGQGWLLRGRSGGGGWGQIGGDAACEPSAAWCHPPLFILELPPVFRQRCHLQSCLCCLPFPIPPSCLCGAGTASGLGWWVQGGGLSIFPAAPRWGRVGG